MTAVSAGFWGIVVVAIDFSSLVRGGRRIVRKSLLAGLSRLRKTVFLGDATNQSGPRTGRYAPESAAVALQSLAVCAALVCVKRNSALQQRRRQTEGPCNMAFLGGVVGLVVGWVVTAAVVIIGGNLIGVTDFEGALSMGAIFAYGPMGGLIGLIAGVWIVRRMRRAKATQI
jgi:hypothetical protein